MPIRVVMPASIIPESEREIETVEERKRVEGRVNRYTYIPISSVRFAGVARGSDGALISCVIRRNVKRKLKPIDWVMVRPDNYVRFASPFCGLAAHARENLFAYRSS